jgi:parallel beta-helix repeat protein
MKRTSTLSLVIFLALSSIALSSTIHVPADRPTIQAGIDAAREGDLVLVAPGIYVENINFLGKAITVKSSKGPTVTIISAKHPGSVVVFKNHESKDSVLKGFTVTNGFCNYGAGILCDASAPTSSNNQIIRNKAVLSGGGIHCDNYSSPLIEGNFISGNSGKYGGGIVCNYNPPSSYPGPVIKGNIITRNHATGSGGAGGGIACSFSDPEIANNIFLENTAMYHGGGISCDGGSWPTLTNNTFVRNEVIKEPNGYGGAIFSGFSSSVEVTNTIFWDNRASKGPQICVGIYNSQAALLISYSDLQGDQAGLFLDPAAILIWGEGMIDEEPLFVDEPGNDFHLCYPSPCRDAGSNSAVTEILLDNEGDPRIAYGIVDMGADEFYTHLYCTGKHTPGGAIKGKLVGLPGTEPACLFIGSRVLDTPMQTKWGSFYLNAPWSMIGPLGSIPADGIMELGATLPMSPPAPYDLPMQALIGLEHDSLTNLFVLEVRD